MDTICTSIVYLACFPKSPEVFERNAQGEHGKTVEDIAPLVDPCHSREVQAPSATVLPWFWFRIWGMRTLELEGRSVGAFCIEKNKVVGLRFSQIQRMHESGRSLCI
jgi:hypothetical protein